ncbi:MAG TPA: enoyl-CoA hydratase/isomerase family protein, partial [Longimicrobiales bacterium]
MDSGLSDGVARLVVDAPPLNILTRDVLRNIRADLERIAAQQDTRVLLLTARGQHFSAGASVEEHLPPECAVMIDEFIETVLAMHDFPLPIIAAVQG